MADIREVLKRDRLYLADVETLTSDAAKANVGYLGSRFVTVEGYSGSVAISDIAKLIHKWAINAEANHDYTREERVRARAVSRKITQYYQETDRAIQESIICWIFAYIREYMSPDFIRKEKWEGVHGWNQHFTCGTIERLRNEAIHPALVTLADQVREITSRSEQPL